MKENDLKLRKAVKKAIEERGMQDVKSEEIERLQAEIKNSNKLKKLLSKKILNRRKFPDYLVNVGYTNAMWAKCTKLKKDFQIEL